MNTDVQGLIELAFDKITMLVAGGIYVLLRFLQKVPRLSDWPPYRRALPIMPEVIGGLVAIFGGLPAVNDQPWVVRIAAGLWCSYLAQKFHKILGQTILGDDRLSLARSEPSTSKPSSPASTPGG